MIPCQDIPIAGVQYGDYKMVPDIAEGDKLGFCWEPQNRFDTNAIRIDWLAPNGGRVKLGYVPKGGFQDLIHEYRLVGIQLRPTLIHFRPEGDTFKMFVVRLECDTTLSSEILRLRQQNQTTTTTATT